MNCITVIFKSRFTHTWILFEYFECEILKKCFFNLGTVFLSQLIILFFFVNEDRRFIHFVFIPTPAARSDYKKKNEVKIQIFRYRPESRKNSNSDLFASRQTTKNRRKMSLKKCTSNARKKCDKVWVQAHVLIAVNQIQTKSGQVTKTFFGTRKSKISVGNACLNSKTKHTIVSNPNLLHRNQFSESVRRNKSVQITRFYPS